MSLYFSDEKLEIIFDERDGRGNIDLLEHIERISMMVKMNIAYCEKIKSETMLYTKCQKRAIINTAQL
jgi:hypothetical protein